MAGPPKPLTGSPGERPNGAGADDALSEVLRAVRLTGSLQFCFMPSGAWQTDGRPRLASLAGAGSLGTMPFHIMVEGTCWLRMEGQEHVLVAGDVVAFPFGTGHQLGAGEDGRLVTPIDDLPPKPWREIPVLRYGDGPARVRLLCGFLQCDAVGFAPLRAALPAMLHMRAGAGDDTGWVAATIRQLVAEVDRPRAGSQSLLERLTELIFIELLRQEIARAEAGGWLAALGDPALGRCLALIHGDPRREWTLASLAVAAGLSRSTLAQRFESVLRSSPMRYLRDWRLHLAGVALKTTRKGIAAVAHEAGYGTEAAFNRAFSRSYGTPPAAWRRGAG